MHLLTRLLGALAECIRNTLGELVRLCKELLVKLEKARKVFFIHSTAAPLVISKKESLFQWCFSLSALATLRQDTQEVPATAFISSGGGG